MVSSSLRAFNSRYKLPVHILQIVLVIICIGLSVPRLFMKNQPRTRANTIALGMGAKSLIVIFYQILTEHVAYFRRWASLKANLILNCLETVFWGAVVFLVLQSNISSCRGIGCTLSWIVVGVAIVNNLACYYMAVVSYLDFRRFKKGSSQGKYEDRVRVVSSGGEDGLPMNRRSEEK